MTPSPAQESVSDERLAEIVATFDARGYFLLRDQTDAITALRELQRLRQGAASAETTDWVLALAEGMKLAGCDIKRVPIVPSPDVVADWLKECVSKGAATDVRTAGEGLTQEQREALNWAATTAQLQAGNMDGVFRPYETCAYMARISSTLRALASPPSNGDAK